MKNHIISLLAACAVFAAFAGYDVVSLRNGETYTASAPAKIARVNALSTTADGTVALKSESKYAAIADVDVLSYTTNFTYTVVGTNYVAGSLVTTTNTVAFDPYPFGHDNWISFTTNAIVTTVTNKVRTSSATVVATNALSSITCSSGVGANTPSDAWILPGDVLFFDGTATGIVNVILTR